MGKSSILKIISFALSVSLTLVFAGHALAQEGKPQIAIAIEVFKEVVTMNEGGQEVSRKPVFKAESGDVLVYVLTYENKGNSVATNAAIVDPVPAGTVYVLGSAEGEGTTITYSIDGGKSYQGAPVTYLRQKPDGSTEQVAAPPEMYTHIKWLLREPLQPEDSGNASFKVTVQ